VSMHLTMERATGIEPA